MTVCIVNFPASQDVEETAGSVRHKNCPVSLHPCGRDAYLLFQVYTYFLITEFEVCTVTYGPSFCSDLWPQPKACKPKIRAEKMRFLKLIVWIEEKKLLRYVLSI